MFVAVTRNGGTMADAGSTAWMFIRALSSSPSSKIVARFSRRSSLRPLDADPEEISDLGDSFEIITEPSNTGGAQAGLDYESAEVSSCRSTPGGRRTNRKLMRIIDALEDSDDVQNVYSNFDASDEVLASIS